MLLTQENKKRLLMYRQEQDHSVQRAMAIQLQQQQQQMLTQAQRQAQAQAQAQVFAQAAPPQSAPPQPAPPQPAPPQSAQQQQQALQAYQMSLARLQQQRIQQPQQQQQQTLAQHSGLIGGNEVQGLTSTEDDPYDSDSSDGTISAAENRSSKKLRLATASSGSYGTTTTYELPGKRTVPFSRLERQHVITEISLSSVAFYHVAVPKLREAVFLNASIVNTSTTYLLKGSAGLTVDGSYLGNSSIPQCAPGEKFTISLGVDEEIQIRYSKPVRKLSSQATSFMGLNTELVQRFFRKFHVQNTSLNPRPVKLLVMDQVPVSGDERLKVTIVNPVGLKKEGDKAAVNLGGAARQGALRPQRENQEKSVGTVQLKQGGEISWELELSKGQRMEAILEYEARLPGSETITHT